MKKIALVKKYSLNQVILEKNRSSEIRIMQGPGVVLFLATLKTEKNSCQIVDTLKTTVGCTGCSKANLDTLNGSCD